MWDKIMTENGFEVFMGDFVHGLRLSHRTTLKAKP
jgi:hypothetical protein